MAGVIEKRAEKSKQFKCDICESVFEINQKVDSSFFVKQKKNSIPCESTTTICKITNEIMTQYFKLAQESRFDCKNVLDKITREISNQNLFEESNFDHDPEVLGQNTKQC